MHTVRVLFFAIFTRICLHNRLMLMCCDATIASKQASSMQELTAMEALRTHMHTYIQLQKYVHTCTEEAENMTHNPHSPLNVTATCSALFAYLLFLYFFALFFRFSVLCSLRNIVYKNQEIRIEHQNSKLK